VGVLGPRKLGLLIIFALAGLKQHTNDYTITSLARHRYVASISNENNALLGRC